MRSNGRTIEQEFESEAMPHHGELYRTALRLLSGDREEASDLVQDVFVQAWKSFDAYQPGTNCRAWLYAILMNKVRHYYRRQMKGRVVRLSEETERPVSDKRESDSISTEEIGDEEILRALGNLTEDHREVILLTDVQGFSYKEAAEILEVPIGTVMSRLSRGRRILREELASYAKEFGIDTTRWKR